MLRLAIALAAALVPAARAESSDPVAPPPRNSDLPGVAAVKSMLRGTIRHCAFDQTDEAEAAVMQLGDRAFPAYEAILADPNSELRLVGAAFDMIARMQTDRRRFVPLAVGRFADPEGTIRVDGPRVLDRPDVDRYRGGLEVAVPTGVETAVMFVQWTSFRRGLARGSAVDFLAQIGDDRDADPLVPLLSDGHDHVRDSAARALAKIGGKNHLDAMDAWLKDPVGPPTHIARVKSCRDELAARLKKNPVPKHWRD